MKNVLVVFFFGIIFGSNICFSQSEINQVDAQGERHGIWKKHYPKSDQLRYEGKFEHGKEVGEFKFYCEDCKDKPNAIKVFNKKNDIAEVKYFTAKGKLVSEGQMDGKDRFGDWIYYHNNSKVIMTRENYVNGKLNGKIVTYYPDGKITEEIEYKNGVKDGENNYYSPTGVLLKKLIYKNEELDGLVIYYDAHGNVLIEGNYKEGKKHGLWKYYKDGKMELEETFPKKNRE